MLVYKCPRCKTIFGTNNGYTCPKCNHKNVEMCDESDTKKFLESSELAQKLLMDLGGGCREDIVAAGILHGIASSHRTCQQSFGRLLQRVIFFFASLDKPGWCDQRNEGMVKMCVKLREVCKDEYLSPL